MKHSPPNRLQLNRRDVLAMGALAATSRAFAQSAGPYPAKPISVLVGLQAGTGSDVGVRAVTEKLSALLRQPITVENLPGAGGQLAAARALRAPADGYALFALSSATVTAGPILDKNAGFDPLKDLVPVATIATIPSAFFVRPDLPVRTLREYIAMAKAKPDALTYASGGMGSAQHIGMEIFKSMTGIAVMHIPYRGSVQAVTDAVGGRVDSGLQGLSTVLPYIRSGRLRALAATGTARTNLLPDLPTVKELGIADFVYEPWTALFAPAGTPPDVIGALNAAVRRVIAEPEFKARFEAIGLEVAPDTPEQLGARLRIEYSSTATIVRERGIKAE
jgi:tripartite-type tricarboxylate transporter receptor subunit TctC